MAPCVPPPQGLKAPHIRQGGARHLLQSFMHPVAPPQHGVSADDLAESFDMGGESLNGSGLEQVREIMPATKRLKCGSTPLQI